MDKKEAVEEFINRINQVLPDFKITVQQMRYPNADILFEFINKFMTKIGVDPDRFIFLISLDREIYGNIVQPIAYCTMLKSFVTETPKCIAEDLKPGTFLIPVYKITKFLFNMGVNYLVFSGNFNDKYLSEIRINYDNRYIKKEEVKQQEQKVKTYKNNLAIKKGTREPRRSELNKEKPDLKHKLNELKKEKENLNSLDSSLKYELEILSKDIPTQSKSDLDCQQYKTSTYIDSKLEENKLIHKKTSIIESKNSLKESVKDAKVEKINLQKILECDVFSDTLLKQHTTDIYREEEDDKKEIESLTHDLRLLRSNNITDMKIQHIETEIVELDENHATLEKNMPFMQQNFSKIKKVHTQTYADYESKIDDINYVYSTFKSMLKSIIHEKENLLEKSRILDEECRRSYRKILEKQESTHATFVKLTKDVEDQMLKCKDLRKCNE